VLPVSSSYPNKSRVEGCLFDVSNICCVALFLAIAAVVFPDKYAADGTKNKESQNQLDRNNEFASRRDDAENENRKIYC
jgi:hypothetical protein